MGWEVDRRIEERYIIHNDDVEEVVGAIKNAGGEELDTSRLYNVTLYFDGADLELPITLTIRGRTYLSEPVDEVLPEEEWILEIKKDVSLNGRSVRIKTRKRGLTLSQLAEAVNALTPLPVMPKILVVYQRRHYKMDDMRITVDRDISYYIVSEDYKINRLGREKHARVEIKYPPESGPAKKKLAVLLAEKGVPAVSKKTAAFNLYSKYLRILSGSRPPKTEVEIETKFNVPANLRSNILEDIKRLVAEGRIKDFSLYTEFPNTSKKGSIHVFYPGERVGEFSRLGISSFGAGWTHKSLVRSLKYGSITVLIRKKRSGKDYSDPLEEEVREAVINAAHPPVFRARKYFVVEHDVTGETFCITLDRTVFLSSARDLWQLEIEAYGEGEEERLYKGVSRLARMIYAYFPDLRLTTLSKYEWVRSTPGSDT